MRDLQNPFIIFSIKRNDFPESANRDNHRAYELTFKNIGLQFKSVLGFYKGECEESFLVLDTPENRDFAIGLAKKEHQESILFVDADRQANLLFLNINTVQNIGKFVSATKEHALKQDAWTFDPETETFYVTA